MDDEQVPPSLDSPKQPSGGSGMPAVEAKKDTVADTVSDALSDPKSLVKVATKKVIKLFFANPVLLAQVVVVVLALAAASRLVGYDPFYFVPVWKPLSTSYDHYPVMDSASWIQEASSMQSCLANAKSLSRPYVLEHVIQYLDYEDDQAVAGSRQVHERILYTILPLRDISADEQIYLEEYSGTALTSHWFGPRREVPVGGNNKYQVVFDGKLGQATTIVTGAEFKYPLPLSDGRAAFRDATKVGRDQDFWIYQNIDDVICDFDQIIDSRTLTLTPEGRGGYRTDGKIPVQNDVIYQPGTYSPSSNSALQSHWSLVQPGEDVGIVFRVHKLN